MYMSREDHYVSDEVTYCVSMKETEIAFKVNRKLSLTRTKKEPVEIRKHLQQKYLVIKGRGYAGYVRGSKALRSIKQG